MEWGLLGTVPKQTGKKHQNIFSWFEEGEKQNHITGNVSTRFCNLRKHVKAKLISSSSQITVQKGFSLKISKDGNEKLDVTEVRWTETYNNSAKKKSWILLLLLSWSSTRWRWRRWTRIAPNSLFGNLGARSRYETQHWGAISILIQS